MSLTPVFKNYQDYEERQIQIKRKSLTFKGLHYERLTFIYALDETGTRWVETFIYVERSFLIREGLEFTRRIKNLYPLIFSYGERVKDESKYTRLQAIITKNKNRNKIGLIITGFRNQSGLQTREPSL